MRKRDDYEDLREALRSSEGASITILCNNPEADSVDVQCALDVSDDWTEWKDRRFHGRDVADCLNKAIEARHVFCSQGAAR